MSYYTGPALTQASRLYVIATRAKRDGATPGRKRIARDAFERALVGLVAAEDADGIDAVAWLSDNLTNARKCAMAAGVLTAEDVSRIERKATSVPASPDTSAHDRRADAEEE